MCVKPMVIPAVRDQSRIAEAAAKPAIWGSPQRHAADEHGAFAILRHHGLVGGATFPFRLQDLRVEDSDRDDDRVIRILMRYRTFLAS